MSALPRLYALTTLVLLGALLAACAPSGQDDVVNVYSYRQDNLIRPILDEFSEQTGIQVNLVTGAADGLIERLRNEAARSPADILLTVDAGRLVRAKELGLLQAIESDTLRQRVPAQYRDPEDHWFGLSLRARVLFYNPEAVSHEDLPEDYLGLADERWRGRLCVRSSDNIYNQSLLAALIAHHGEQQAEEWAGGVVANLARSPQGNDRSQITGVAVGACDLGLANTYYYGRMQESSERSEREQAAAVALHFPSGEHGTHINISGAGVTRHAPNRDNAIRLMEFLASDQAQRFYADANMEYPVVAGTEPSEQVRQWGYPFEADSLNVTRLGELNEAAVRIFDRAGWR